MVLQLYGDLLSQPTRAVALFLLSNNIGYDFQFLNLSKLDHKRPDYLAINPRGQVPAIDDDGFNLNESATILRYLAVTRSVPDHWYPADAKKRARVDGLMDWYQTNLRHTARYVFAKELQVPVLKAPQPTEEEVRSHEKNMTASMNHLEGIFLTEEGPFLLGASQPSVADLLLACEVTQLYLLEKQDCERILGPRLRVRKWLQALESALAPHYSELHRRVQDTAKLLESKRVKGHQAAL